MTVKKLRRHVSVFITGSLAHYYRLQEPIIVNTLWDNNDLPVQAFGNNIAESEPISNSEPNVCVGGLDLEDFGRDPRSSDSLRGLFSKKKRKKCSQNFEVL